MENDSPKAQISNTPKQFWQYLVLTTTYTSAILISISVAIIRLQHTFKFPENVSFNPQNLIGTIGLSICVISLFSFLIKPLQTTLKYIFEETEDKDNFKKNINYVIRSQFFIPIFYILVVFLLCESGFWLGWKTVFFIFNILIDLFINLKNIDLGFNMYIVSAIFGLISCILLKDLSSLLILITIKAMVYLYDKFKKTNQNIFDEEKGVSNRIRICSFLILLNIYIAGYFIMIKPETIKIHEKGWSTIIGIYNLLKSIILPNISKVFTSVF
ncbi:hypothetical protein CWI37_1548p0010 [Hamiltosporidium tvaerminnensis]|uniref:Uncharacterized protein n=2 Tax=Hamiltosporidium TaxID=1176354 RepID=A0A4Q9KVK7_9MICR|nr:hypothetical protein LUQ84_001580 [Hamiltosporidium tvaerminnensis]TBT98903.1 hypothetical protein CWI37_1548p0010 [Hamiltosporidium tvaerminnensis]